MCIRRGRLFALSCQVVPTRTFHSIQAIMRFPMLFVFGMVLQGAFGQGAQPYAPGWTVAEVAAADLARGETAWTDEEKNALLHVNLARLYPSKYWNIEVEPWDPGEKYQRDDAKELASLKRTLVSMAPVAALSPSSTLRAEAQCLAKLQARTGAIGHERGSRCPIAPQQMWAENCSYGYSGGRDIIISLLIDENVPSLGHRENCLDPGLKRCGIFQGDHARYGGMAVMDFAQ
jgi:hypothetical protein